MQIIEFAVLFLAVASFARADSSEEVLEHVKSKHLRKLIKEHGGIEGGLSKLEEACPGSQEKLKSAIAELKRCDDEADESGLTICEAVNRYALNCSRPLISLIDDCIPPKARGLAALGSKSLVSVVQYLCGLQGESIIELINPCIFEDPPELTQQLEECESKISELAAKYKNGVPSPSEICGLSGDVKTCFQAQLNLNCKNAKTRSSFIGLLDALSAPCSALNEI